MPADVMAMRKFEQEWAALRLSGTQRGLKLARQLWRRCHSSITCLGILLVADGKLDGELNYWEGEGIWQFIDSRSCERKAPVCVAYSAVWA